MTEQKLKTGYPLRSRTYDHPVSLLGNHRIKTNKYGRFSTAQVLHRGNKTTPAKQAATISVTRRPSGKWR